ncbi:MAG: family containing protein [Mucilaginibacter sp.]|nr:family containing protein [Mucilaginibacter sp.]MDB5016679.1 family containing protein [Mucilaginibacter sp.]
MKRRSFVKTSLLTAAAGAAMSQISSAAESSAKGGAQFYELRTYLLKNEQQQKLVEAYFKDAAIPALNRLGNKNIGVFTELKPAGQTNMYVLIPYNSWTDYITVQDKLAADKAYLEAGEAYLNAPATAPAYDRIDSSLLKAFAHMPQLQAPQQKPRIFELRRYEHASESAGKKKLEMFNDAGEINIFKRLGFDPVFFGETLIGELRPNLIYMITFDDMEAHNSHWKAFGSDPEWKKLSGMPEYADAKLVSHITSTMLKPTAFSQI